MSFDYPETTAKSYYQSPVSIKSAYNSNEQLVCLTKEKNMLLDSCADLRMKVKELEEKVPKNCDPKYGRRIEALENQVEGLSRAFNKWTTQVKY